MLFPELQRETDILSVFHRDSLGLTLKLSNISGLNQRIWPAARKILYVPFVLQEPVNQVTRLFICHSTGTTDSFILGIYNADGVQLCATAPTACSGINSVQYVTPTTTPTLGIGSYYFAMAVGGTTTTTGGADSSDITTNRLSYVQQCGILQESTIPATLSLFSVATFAAPTSVYIPFCGVSFRPVG
jgi:hypothetical protein